MFNHVIKTAVMALFINPKLIIVSKQILKNPNNELIQ